MIYNNVLEAIGNTPLIRLNRMTGENDAQVLVKYEGVNIGGSIKTRTAFNMIKKGEEMGLIKPDSIIVEVSSGNQGIGLALVGAVRGYKTVVLMPDSVSGERMKLMNSYGAEVILVPEENDIGKCIETCQEMANKMAQEDERVFLPLQFENEANTYTHRYETGAEIVEQAGCKIDGFCAGIGTGGTITGIGQKLREENPDTLIWAVEPNEAAILSGMPTSTHMQMGIGDGLIPQILDTQIYDDICIVTDEEALQTAKDLALKEGLMCGISSGSNVAAALKLAKQLGAGKTVVTILPDTAERYFSTPLFDE